MEITAKDKAKEILQRHYNKIQEVTAGMFDDDAPTHDLVYRAAKECAKLECKGIIKANPIVPMEYMLESEALDAANEFWKYVLKEIDNV